MDTWLSWSSGKDSTWSLHVLRQGGEAEVTGLLSTPPSTAWPCTACGTPSLRRRRTRPACPSPSHALACEMIDGGLVAHVTCVDPARLDRSFAGRPFDQALVADLPAEADPCGENSEFHTCVAARPMFRAPVTMRLGAIAERDGFVFADLLPG